MKKTVSILGTPYQIYMRIPYDKDRALNHRFGYCSMKERKIVVGDLDILENWKNESDKMKSRQYADTLRHEIIHAYFMESGLWSSSLTYDEGWATNEEMTDWIALQIPKMNKTFAEVGCLGGELKWKK